MDDQLIRRIKAETIDEPAFLELGLRLSGAGNLGGLTEILTYRNARGGSGSALAFEIASHLLASGRLDEVFGLCRGFGDTNPFSAALHCAAGFGHFLRFEHDQGLALLREGVRRLSLLVEQHPRETLPPAYLTKLVAAAFLFEPLDRPPGATGDPGPLTLLHPGDWAGRAALCAAFGDSLYFRTYGERLAVTAVDGLDTRAELDGDLMELRRTATDEYASQRSLYLQHRQSLVTNQQTSVQQLPDFDAPTGGAPQAPEQAKPAEPKGE